MSNEIFSFVVSACSVRGLLFLCIITALSAAILTPLEHVFPAHHQRLILRREFYVDFAWWFFTPIITRLITNLVLVVLFLSFAGVARIPIDSELMSGFGPIGAQPLSLQTLELLLLADLIDYWTHRTFHTSRLWPFHAVHHSPNEMSWLSSSRVHPVNDLVTRACQVLPLVALGFSPRGVVEIVPYLAFYVMFLHANISWDFGPFRWLLVSPAYHRWHHTSDREGIDKNFAGIFPIWDLLFGTAHFPRRLPKRYGVRGDPPPESLLEQLAYPFARLQEMSSKTSTATHDRNHFERSGPLLRFE